MIAIHCGTLIDGISDEPVDDAIVLVENGRIRESGPRDVVSVPQRADRVDHSDHVVLPGLIDAHQHLNGDRTFEPYGRLTKEVPLSTARAAADLRASLRAGFTSVRDAGSAGGMGLKRAVNEGSIPGPRIYSSSGTLSQTAGAADHTALPFDWVDSDPSRLAAMWESTVVDGEDACRRAAREKIREGADFVKIFGTGAGYHGLGQPENPAFTPGEIRAITEEAHRVNVPVASHSIGIEGTKQAIDSGVDTIEHGWYLDGETIDLMLREETILVPTLLAIHQFAHEGTEENTPPRFYESLGGNENALEAEESAIESVSMAYEAGIPIALGTDSLGVDLLPHGENVREAELLHRRVGLSEMDTIKAATSVAARAIDDADIGAIEPGRRADVIAIRGHPIDHIGELRNVVAVYKDGAEVEC